MLYRKPGFWLHRLITHVQTTAMKMLQTGFWMLNSVLDLLCSCLSNGKLFTAQCPEIPYSRCSRASFPYMNSLNEHNVSFGTVWICVTQQISPSPSGSLSKWTTWHRFRTGVKRLVMEHKRIGTSVCERVLWGAGVRAADLGHVCSSQGSVLERFSAKLNTVSCGFLKCT